MRPLTLLNNDYKILAKALDNRLSALLPKIIHNDQTGFVKGRNIAHNIRKSIEVIDFCNAKRIPSVIMSCDMEKCFDHIEHSAVFGCLRNLGFGPNFVRWISLFFTDFQVCTQNYGNLSHWFVKERGVNQGCPISPGAYLCAGEALANAIRKHKDIKGISICEIEYLLSQFVDDIDLYLPFDSKVINAVLEVLDLIEKKYRFENII